MLLLVPRSPDPIWNHISSGGNVEVLLWAGAIWGVSMLWLLVLIWRAPLLDNDEARSPTDHIQHGG